MSDVEYDAQFRTFAPAPVKIRGGVGEISIPIVEALPTTEPPAAERGVLLTSSSAIAERPRCRVC